jgi:hypothetical protein
MTGGYDFSQLYGMADHSGGLIDAGTYAAVIESSEHGRSKDGTKGQWKIKTRITDPASPYLGKQLTGDITISPENPKAVGIMFRHLGALGVAVPDPKNPAMVVNGPVPFWIDPNSRQPLPNDGTAERWAAQVMTGKPVKIRVVQNEWDGGVNNKIMDWQPNPGGPTTWPQTQQGAPASPFQQGQGFSAAGQPQQPYGYGQAAASYPPQQPGNYAQPGYPPQGPPQGYPQPGGQQAPPPWQAAQQPQQPFPGQPVPGQPGMGAAPAGAAPQYPAPGPGVAPGWQPQGQPPPQGQLPVPGAPAWAQPPQPGQGGMGEFTPGGASQQPGMAPGGPQQPPAAPVPPWAQQQPQGQPGQPQQGTPQPPWAQQPGQPNGQPQYPAQQPQGPGEAPQLPPWAQ